MALNAQAIQRALDGGARAATAGTGFGLLWHGHGGGVRERARGGGSCRRRAGAAGRWSPVDLNVIADRVGVAIDARGQAIVGVYDGGQWRSRAARPLEWRGRGAWDGWRRLVPRSVAWTKCRFSWANRSDPHWARSDTRQRPPRTLLSREPHPPARNYATRSKLPLIFATSLSGNSTRRTVAATTIAKSPRRQTRAEVGEDQSSTSRAIFPRQVRPNQRGGMELDDVAVALRVTQSWDARQQLRGHGRCAQSSRHLGIAGGEIEALSALARKFGDVLTEERSCSWRIGETRPRAVARSCFRGARRISARLTLGASSA